MRAIIGAMAVVLACGACGGDDGGGGPVTLDELPDAYTQVLCDRLVECSVFGALILTQTSCEALSYDFRNDGAASLQQGIDDGTIVYDPAAMGACLDALASVPCEDLSPEIITDLEACAGAIVGQQADGEACSDNLQCERGLYCDLDLACPGTCAPRVTSGGDCTGATCAAGLTCDSTSVCSPPLGAGADCTDESCPSGFVCSSSTTTCVAMTHTAGSGAACDPNEGVLCAGALVCAGEAADAFVCRAKVGVGDPCFVSIPNPCPADVVCSAVDVGVEGTCEALPAAGEPCRTSGGLFDLQCVGEAVCDDASGDCTARVDNGGACTIDAECANACDVTCQEPVPCP